MKPALARRQAALAGVALVGALGAIALTRIGDDPEPPPQQATVEWREARVGILAAPEEATACGDPLTPSTAGVAHPVLPCGAVLIVEHEGRRARAEVVARGAPEDGQAFDVTPALAQRLGIASDAVVRWRFAG
ncbi:MAG: hypothetical protein ACRDLA_18500 [Thermoleophilaceae bacterium]